MRPVLVYCRATGTDFACDCGAGHVFRTKFPGSLFSRAVVRSVLGLHLDTPIEFRML